MSGLRRGHGIPGELHVNLEEVPKLELRYSRAQLEKMTFTSSTSAVGSRYMRWTGT